MSFPTAMAAFNPDDATTLISTPAPWTLDALHNVDPVLGFAVVMLLAVVVGEALHRTARLPRICGQMLIGALASPLVLRLFSRAELDPWKPLIDLAIGVLVFELGTRIRPRWLIDNPWLALTCLLESALTGLLVAGGLVVLGAQPLAALVAGAIAMSTSPVITMVIVHETRPRGQVSERLLLMCAVNSVIAMLAIKAWRVWAAVDGPPGSELMAAATGATTVICGSFLLGVATGYALDRLSRPVRGESALAVLQIALVIVAALLATQWKLSPLLVLLVAGVVSRDRMGHRLTVEPHLGTAGAALSVLLFISFGVLFTLENASMLWPWVAAIIVTRFAGKALAIMALAKPSGLSGRQAIALTLALQPMGSLTVLLAADTFDWSIHLPGVGSPALQALLIATTLMQLTGPVWSQLALQLVARETYDG